MPLYAMHALHYVCSCDACGARSPLLCTRELPTGRREAVERLAALGWTQHVSDAERAREAGAWLEAQGAGEWRCPACGATRVPS